MKKLQEMFKRLAPDARSKLYKCHPGFRGNVTLKPEHPDGEIGYVRVGIIPKSGFTTSVESGFPESGVSCFEAEIMPNGNYRFIHLTDYLLTTLSARLLNEYTNAEKSVYRVYGELVGQGSAGEPLIKVIRAERLTGKCVGPAEVVETRMFNSCN